MVGIAQGFSNLTHLIIGSNKMKKSLLSAVALTAMVAFSGNAWADLLIGETCFNAAGEPVNYAIDYRRGSHFTFSLVRK